MYYTYFMYIIYLHILWTLFGFYKYFLIFLRVFERMHICIFWGEALLVQKYVCDHLNSRLSKKAIPK